MIIRLETHPIDDQIAVMHTPQELNQHIAKLPDARYSPTDRAYLIEHSALPALHAFAAHVGARIVDNRARNTGPRTLPQECRHCAQPGSTTNPPDYCPSCGRPWDPIPPPDGSTDDVRRHTCPACGHPQNGRFAHCAKCGATMSYTAAPAPTVKREHGEPQPLGSLVDNVLDIAATRDGIRDDTA